MQQGSLERLAEGLTEPQTKAVRHMDGPLLVLAGPGSGKTTVVTRRIAHLVSQGIPAWQILGLTFTNKAAGEMRARVARQLPDDLPGRRGLTVATFHAFCARLLRRYADAAGVASSYTIYDSADQRSAIKLALKNAGLNERNFTPGAIASAVSAAKNRLLDASGFAAEASDFYARSMAKAYTAYEKILRENGALDFDDLLLVTARLLRDDGAVRGELQGRYQYLLVDEYQDTNHAQFVIAGALAAEHRNICVVGDPDQSIYGWRGADIRNILEFEQQYPEAEIIPLGRNFRSTGHIVAAADHLIRNNQHRKHKPLHTELGDGEKPTLIHASDEHHEASIVVEEFRRLHAEDGTPWKEMAVLYRMNALSRVLEDTFRDAQVPHVVARGTAFYQRKEVKDALAYLRLIANPEDEVSLRRVVNTPARGISKATQDRADSYGLGRDLRLFAALRRAEGIPGVSARAAASVAKFVAMVDGWRAAAELEPAAHDASLADAAADGDEGAPALAALVERVIRESGLERLYQKSHSEEDLERLENLEELINAAAQFRPLVDERDPVEAASEPDDEEAPGRTVLDRLRAYLESVALVSDADAVDPENGAVTLMTLHAAKGLEFDAVAIVGLESGVLPHSRSADSEMQMEEERRLCFVGITRAKRHLLLTNAGRRTHRGVRERTLPSPFLGELPAEHLIGQELDVDDPYARDPDPFDDDVVFDGSSGAGGAAARTRRLGHGGSIAASFPAGALVRHPTFGVGRVVSVSPRAAGSSARVEFTSVGTKTLILEYAKLERID